MGAEVSERREILVKTPEGDRGRGNELPGARRWPGPRAGHSRRRGDFLPLSGAIAPGGRVAKQPGRGEGS